MKVPLSWLREFVAVDWPAQQLAHALNMAGIEVESVVHVGEAWEGVFIGQIKGIARHPRADSLFILEVDLADRRVTLVAASPGLRIGDKVPVVLPGGRLGPGEVVGRKVFHGVTSEGMLCSGAELGVSPDADHVYVMEEEAPLGAPLADYLGDVVLDLYITPNRPDLMSVEGVAREVHAITGAPMHRLIVPSPEGPRRAADVIGVQVLDPDLCPRYTATVVQDVTVGPSPQPFQRRLFLAGVRPISNVVDVTNYVMLEMGQPLHAFDRDRLHGGIVVRRARPGERIVTIDGVERDLTEDMLVIADEAVPQAVAGVMGGQASEVSESTRHVVIESANFKASSIRRTSRSLRLASEASRRFERGLDREQTRRAAERAVQLIVGLAGGTAASGAVDVYLQPAVPREIKVTVGQISGLLGRDYSSQEVRRVLESLDFAVQTGPDDQLRVKVPSFRGDVEGRADLAEEVARITGYDLIPETLPAGRLPEPRLEPAGRWERRLKAALVAAGFQEVITYSLVDPYTPQRLDSTAAWPAEKAPDGLIQVFNPLSADHSALRTTLVGSLLSVVRSNLRHTDRVQVFELARVYLPPLQPLPEERRKLALAMVGPRFPRSWLTLPEPVDFFDLKGAVEAALAPFRLREVRWVPSAHPTYHPGQAAEVVALGQKGGERSLGVVGRLHPVVADRYDLGGQAVYVGELDFQALVELGVEEVEVAPLPRFPGVQIDIAVQVAEGVTNEAIEKEIQEAGGPLLERLLLFDVYRGAPVPPGHKSMAYALTFRSPERTLTDEEVEAVRQQIEHRLAEKLGAQIRGR